MASILVPARQFTSPNEKPVSVSTIADGTPFASGSRGFPMAPPGESATDGMFIFPDGPHDQSLRSGADGNSNLDARWKSIPTASTLISIDGHLFPTTRGPLGEPLHVDADGKPISTVKRCTSPDGELLTVPIHAVGMPSALGPHGIPIALYR